MVKMIVTDLDGTLLRSDKTVSVYTVSVFEQCMKRGIKVVFATARPPRAVEQIKAEVKTDACIYHNGAIITAGDTPFQNIGIDCETARELLGKIEIDENRKIAIEIDDKLYANFDTSTVWPGVGMILTDFSDLPEKPIDKIIFITADRNEISEIEKHLNSTLYWEISENRVLMIMNKLARKINAISKLTEHFGISLSDVVAFGDDHNDIEMLRKCGIGVAMENAINEAKSAADFVSCNNDGDGVAKWIESNLLKS